VGFGMSAADAGASAGVVVGAATLSLMRASGEEEARPATNFHAAVAAAAAAGAAARQI
jgi:multisubunit Na+/H+ antiporter MnhB subunit